MADQDQPQAAPTPDAETQAAIEAERQNEKNPEVPEKIIGMDATPEQMEKMVHLGKMMGYPAGDDFDREVHQGLIEMGVIHYEPEEPEP